MCLKTNSIFHEQVTSALYRDLIIKCGPAVYLQSVALWSCATELLNYSNLKLIKQLKIDVRVESLFYHLGDMKNKKCLRGREGQTKDTFDRLNRKYKNRGALKAPVNTWIVMKTS